MRTGEGVLAFAFSRLERRVPCQRVNPPHQPRIPASFRATHCRAVRAIAPVIVLTLGLALASRCGPAVADVEMQVYGVTTRRE